VITRVPIFISAVTSELRGARQLVGNSLQFLGYEPVWQDIFGTEQGDIRDVLRRKIDGCKGLIQLVGQSYGAEPSVPDADWGRVSYTQYEALYARHRGKKVWYLLLQDNFAADIQSDEPAELRELQAAYRRRVQSAMELYHPLATHDALEANVLKMRDELALLRRAARQYAIASFLLLLVLAGASLWIVRGQRQETLQVRSIGSMVNETKKETSSDPRKELANIGIEWSLGHFEQAISRGDLRAIELFLEGGFSANELDGLRENFPFVISDAILNKAPNLPGVLDLFKKHGLNFKATSPETPPLHTLEDDLFMCAAVKGDDQAVMTLKRAGADPTGLFNRFQEKYNAVEERKEEDRKQLGNGAIDEVTLFMNDPELATADHQARNCALYAEYLRGVLQGNGGEQAPGALPAAGEDGPDKLSMKAAFDAATQFENSGDHVKAAKYFEAAAEKGSRNAECNLGNMYINGEMGKVDYAKAREHYQNAATNGDVHAQFNLGLMYAKGEGVGVDYTESVHWFYEAAMQGDPDSEFLLGMAYSDGSGVPKNQEAAESWIKKAADAGSTEAQKWLQREQR
jgi:hypothetical protein